MKKTLIQNIWLSVCLALTAIMLLTASFQFSIVASSEKFEYSSYSKIEDGKEYELSEFCELFGKAEEGHMESDGNLIDYDGKLLEMYGIGAKEEYSSIDYVIDMFNRILSNLRFDVSALLISPVKNILIYILCFALGLSSFTMLITALTASIGAICKSAEDPGEPFQRKGFTGLFAPLLIWGSAFAFMFFNSHSLENVFEVESSITMKYTSGFHFLVTFVVMIAVYFIGEIVLKQVGKNKQTKTNSSTDA